MLKAPNLGTNQYVARELERERVTTGFAASFCLILPDHLLDAVKSLPHGRVKGTPFRGRRQPGWPPREKSDAKIGLELGDAAADGWLRDVEFARGGGETARPGSRFEDQQSACGRNEFCETSHTLSV
ncbi:hypothetical protein ACVINZ_005102 [Mesorhizobium jarvisii]